MNESEPYRALETLIVVIAIVFVFLGTYAKSFGDTANSRLATVYALTNHGTWYIDRPRDEEPIGFEQRTIDKVMIGDRVNGRMLSSKPPMLPLFMTLEYLALNRVLGWSLDDSDDTKEIIRYLSMTLIGLAYVLTLVFFAKTTRFFVDDPSARLLSLFALAFCTQLLGYGTNINNHVPAACLLTIALYFGLGLASGKLAPSAWRFFAFGISGGLVPTIDMPAGIFVFLAGLYLVYKHPRQTLQWTIAGAAIPLAVHFYIMITVTGSPLPVQMRKELYLYESSYWRNPRGIDALNEPRGSYLFHITFGRTGLFLLYPVTFLGVIAAIRGMVKKEFLKRPDLVVGTLGFLVLTFYYVASTNNYGGQAYGFRWYIVAMPILLLMGSSMFSLSKRRWQWLVLAVMIGISYYTAWQCTANPWIANREWTTRFYGPSY